MQVIARMVREDRHSTNSFLRLMIDRFNGKPMLWRFFGVWGDCGCRAPGPRCRPGSATHDCLSMLPAAPRTRGELQSRSVPIKRLRRSRETQLKTRGVPPPGRGAVATVNLDFCTGGRVKNGELLCGTQPPRESAHSPYSSPRQR